MSDEYYRRVALHGTIDPDDVGDDIELTDEELDAVIEIIYFRLEGEYGVYERHIYRGVLHLQHEFPMDEYSRALEHAIDLARSTGHPLLIHIYAWIPSDDPDELGEDRIPSPWESDEDDE